MPDYIDREELRKRFAKRLNWLRKDIHDEYSGALFAGCIVDAELIDELPAADVVPKDGQTVELRVTIKEDEENGNQQ